MTSRLTFSTRLLQPALADNTADKNADKELPWAFVVLPKSVSEKLPRRGKTSVTVTLNDYCFIATLEPDGQLSHWLRLDQVSLSAAAVNTGDLVTFELMPLAQEPEPEIPADLEQALAATPQAQAVWLDTTSIARLDWIHWVTSAKQAKTRAKRINDACQMLAAGKKRVCCFDSSGYYSKAFSAPKYVEEG